VKSNLDEDHYQGGHAYSEKEALNQFLQFFGTDDPYEASFVPVSLEATATVQRRTELYLQVTLEEVYSGATKAFTLHRQLGEGGATDEKTFLVEVPPGCPDGTRFVFKHQGHYITSANSERRPSDLVLIVETLPHAQFQRIGQDLYFKSSITLTEALTGCHLEVPTLDDRILHLAMTDVIHPNYRRTIKEEGLPGRSGTKGDLILYFDVQYPDYVTREQRQALQTVLNE
jgi:DnaJ-class molecular chaperone